MSEETNIYESRVEDCVRRALVSQQFSFESICRSCQGAFPADVLGAIERLSDGSISQSQVTFTYENNANDPNQDLSLEPSPIDYEWRFARESAKEICTLALNCGTKIVCLGTPSVFRELLFQNADAYLIDRNPFVIDSFRQIADGRVLTTDISELNQHPSLGRFDVVVMDPPWYQEHITFWLKAGVCLAREGASVIMTLFPDLVRPAAIEERNTIMKLLGQLGEFNILSKKVAYETPLFERETLAALGIRGLSTWRLADLVKVNLKGTFPPIEVVRPREQRWERFRFGTQVVGLAQDDSNATSIAVGPPYADGSYLLKTVSTRDPVRAAIGLWTSRNRAAIVTGNQRLAGILRTLEAGTEPRKAIQRAVIQPEERSALENLVALIGL